MIRQLAQITFGLIAAIGVFIALSIFESLGMAGAILAVGVLLLSAICMVISLLFAALDQLVSMRAEIERPAREQRDAIAAQLRTERKERKAIATMRRRGTLPPEGADQIRRYPDGEAGDNGER